MMMSLAFLRGWLVGLILAVLILLFAGWVLEGRSAYARGWRDGGFYRLESVGQCDERRDGLWPVTRYGPLTRVGRWHDGCVAAVERRIAATAERQAELDEAARRALEVGGR